MDSPVGKFGGWVVLQRCFLDTHLTPESELITELLYPPPKPVSGNNIPEKSVWGRKARGIRIIYIFSLIYLMTILREKKQDMMHRLAISLLLGFLMLFSFSSFLAS